MLFNEIIETHGIEGVASTTNISTINLGYLVEENFERLNRVKALGFLLILEREYKEIDISALREKIKTYYDEHRPVDDKVVMVARDSVEGGGTGFSFFKLFIVLTVLIGGYYLYTEGKLDSLIQKVEDKKEFFDDKKALENNISNEDAFKVVVGKSDKESISIETPVVSKVDADDSENLKKTAPKSALNIVKSKIVDKSIQSVLKEVSEDFLANETNNSSNTSETEKLTATKSTITTINVNPTRGMLWFGFINLDTKKRREFMKKSSTPFTINNSRWLLVTGHGYLDVVTDEKTLTLADNKKHYFYIDSTEIREINKKEFRTLNGRRGW